MREPPAWPGRPASVRPAYALPHFEGRRSRPRFREQGAACQPLRRPSRVLHPHDPPDAAMLRFPPAGDDFVLTRLAAYYAPHNEQDDNHHCGDNADNQIRIHGSSLKTATDSGRNTTYVALLQPSRRLIGLLAQTLPLSRPYISNRGRRWYRQICHQCIKRHTRRHRIASGPMIFNIEQVGQWCPTLIVVILATATENTYQTGHARHDVMVVELARHHRRGHIRLHDRLSSAARPSHDLPRKRRPRQHFGGYRR